MPETDATATATANATTANTTTITATAGLVSVVDSADSMQLTDFAQSFASANASASANTNASTSATASSAFDSSGKRLSRPKGRGSTYEISVDDLLFHISNKSIINDNDDPSVKGVTTRQISDTIETIETTDSSSSPVQIQTSSSTSTSTSLARALDPIDMERNPPISVGRNTVIGGPSSELGSTIDLTASASASVYTVSDSYRNSNSDSNSVSIINSNSDIDSIRKTNSDSNSSDDTASEASTLTLIHTPLKPNVSVSQLKINTLEEAIVTHGQPSTASFVVIVSLFYSILFCSVLFCSVHISISVFSHHTSKFISVQSAINISE